MIFRQLQKNVTHIRTEKHFFILKKFFGKSKYFEMQYQNYVFEFLKK